MNRCAGGSRSKVSTWERGSVACQPPSPKQHSSKPTTAPNQFSRKNTLEQHLPNTTHDPSSPPLQQHTSTRGTTTRSYKTLQYKNYTVHPGWGEQPHITAHNTNTNQSGTPLSPMRILALHVQE